MGPGIPLEFRKISGGDLQVKTLLPPWVISTRRQPGIYPAARGDPQRPELPFEFLLISLSLEVIQEARKSTRRLPRYPVAG